MDDCYEFLIYDNRTVYEKINFDMQQKSKSFILIDFED